MSIGRTNSGSGGSAFAFIVVSYPIGSTCTCTNGTKTLRAKGTTGNFVFNIPSADTWTVSCTDGQHTSSKTVIITSEGQSESVTLLYRLYILKDGVIDSQFSWSKYGTTSFDVFSNGVISCSSNPGNQGLSGSVFLPTIDATDYSTIVFHTKQTSIHNNNSALCIRVGLSGYSPEITSTSGRKNLFSFYADLTQTSNDFVDLIVDISAATTGLFIATAGNCTYQVDEIYLDV